MSERLENPDVAQAAGTDRKNRVPPANARKPWTEDDDRLLREHYEKHGTKYTARLLGRTNKAVVQRAHDLHVLVAPRRSWTDAEDEYLRRHYAGATAGELAADLDRTEQSVRGRIFLLRLTETNGREWTDEEVAFLRKNYGKITLVEIAAALNRTHPSVEVKSTRLGLRKRPVYREIGPRDIHAVERRLKSEPATHIASDLGIPVHTVYRIARDLGFRHRPTSRPWTPENDDELRRLFGTLPRLEIANQLNRTELAISVRAQILHLTRKVKRVRARNWSHKEEERLRVLARRLTIVQIAAKLGRSRTSISGKMRLLGIKPLRRTAEIETGQG